MKGFAMTKRIVLIILSSLFISICIVCNAQEIQNKVMIENVPIINQFPELPTGCEATALTMLLQYYGVDGSKCDVADRMPKVKLPVKKNGDYVGFHPDEGFIGDPYSKYSYGVFAKPLEDVINTYLPNRALNLTGKSFDEILEYVKNGQPVVIWVTINMKNVVYKNSWKLQDNTIFKWTGNEHAVILVGYDKDNIYVNDPYTGKMQGYNKKVAQNRYIALGNQALAIKEDDDALKILDNDSFNLSVEVLKKAYVRGEHIFVPLSYFPYVTEKIQYTYIDRIVSLEMDGYMVDINLSMQNGEAILNEEITIIYEFKEGITYIDIESIKDALGLEVNILEEGIDIQSKLQ